MIGQRTGSKPLVSIIVPAHNREDLIAETLESVRQQTFQNWECIIVDDHSTDGTPDIAAHFAKMDNRFVPVLLPDPKRYANVARNYGVSLARGEFINFLDHDDLFSPTKLQEQMRVITADSNVAAVICRYARFSTDPKLDGYQVRFAPQDYWLEFLLANEQIYIGHTGCLLWRREFFEYIGGWDESVGSGAWDDHDFFIRIILSKKKIIQLNKVLYYLRRGDYDHLTNRSRDERNKLFRPALHKGWQYIKLASEDNQLRRRLCADNFLRISRDLIYEGHLFEGLWIWIKDSRSIGQTWFRTLWGCVMLLGYKYQLFTSISSRVRHLYYKHRKMLPPPLPHLDGLPTSSPVSMK